MASGDGHAAHATELEKSGCRPAGSAPQIALRLGAPAEDSELARDPLPRSLRDPPSVRVMAVVAPRLARRHGGERPRSASSALVLRLLGPQHLPQGGGRRGGLLRPLRLASSVGPPWRARGVWRSARTRPRSAARRAFPAVLFVALSSGARRQQPPAPCTCQPKGERAVSDRATASPRYDVACRGSRPIDHSALPLGLAGTWRRRLLPTST